MTRFTTTSRGPRITCRTTRRVAALVACAVAAAPILGGCGGDDDTAGSDAGSDLTTVAPNAPTAEETTASTEPAPATSPDDLGDEISTLYLAAYDDVIDTLADRPEPGEATARLTELKDQYIEQLVELGHQREELDESARASVDATILSSVMALPDDTLAEFQAVADHYFDSQDSELYYLITSFNVIGQYANFDLLREQEPDEATRLGIG